MEGRLCSATDVEGTALCVFSDSAGEELNKLAALVSPHGLCRRRWLVNRQLLINGRLLGGRFLSSYRCLLVHGRLLVPAAAT